MNRKIFFYTIWLSFIILSSCKDDTLDLYKRPEWLTGKAYTQIKLQPQLSIFAHALELTGYDTIIDVSGSYTVFAPNNEAFTNFLQSSSYNSVDDIPLPQLNDIVKYMIVQNPWSKTQLQSLDIYGWIDTLDLNNGKPKGFKRQTLLLKDDYYFGLDINNESKIVIIDSAFTDWHRRVINDTRKYVPIFYKDYFKIYNLSGSDYEFYFDRPMENINDLYFAGSKLIGNEIFAENGFIYEVDRVVEPLKNSYEILNNKDGDYSYSQFLDLINKFPNFVYNQDKTFNQPDAELGLEVDSLFDLTYPKLAFNITSEDTKAPIGTFGLPANVAVRYHHGIVAPTNEALNDFMRTYIEGPGQWGNLNSAPENISRIFVNTHLAANAIYQTDIINGFINGESDIQTLNPSYIVQKQFGSNCTFIGTNKAIIPRAFKSVTGPVYTLKGYSTVMNAIESSGLLPALKRQNENYLFFIESDYKLSIDSSLLYDKYKQSFNTVILSPEPGIPGDKVSLDVTDLRTLLLNHTAIEQIQGNSRKEFIKNMAGNYLVVDNLTGVISGSAPTTEGFNGSNFADDPPVQISTDADNGITYEIKNWFSFSNRSIYSLVSSTYPTFHNLLIKAGLADIKEFRYTFMRDNLKYTIFVPSENALNNFQADTLNIEDLKELLLLHFISGPLIFTDGKANPDYYSTSKLDEKSTEFLKIYTKIYINTGVDEIEFQDRNGNSYLIVPESNSTNAIASKSVGDPNQVFILTETTGVVHLIDKVLVADSLDLK